MALGGHGVSSIVGSKRIAGSREEAKGVLSRSLPCAPRRPRVIVARRTEPSHLSSEPPLTPHRRRADFPFAPSRWPFFYGWAIVVFATLGTLMSIPGQTIGVGIFNDFLIDDLDLTRVWISSAYMFGTIASAMTLPLAGRVFDRLGARTMVVFAALGLGATLAYLARCDAIAASLETALCPPRRRAVSCRSPC